MSEAVVFYYHDQIHTVYFNQANAKLPVKLKNGRTQLVSWGRRENENSSMPLGGWARQMNLRSAIHNRWHGCSWKSVQIPVRKFMEKNFEGKSCWYNITKGQCIQGLLVRQKNECRLYIVTVDPETTYHYRWPDLVFVMRNAKIT